MAIGTDASIEFFGTADDLGSSSATVTDGSFSIASDVTQWTNDDDAEKAAIVLFCDWATAPDANSVVFLYARLMNIDSTNDQDVPDSNFQHTRLGAFPINDVTTNQYVAIEINLPNVYTSQVYEFYVKNSTGQTLQSGWKLIITPKASGPHA